MVGIDKLSLRYYNDFKDFIVWCVKHNPKLLYNIYEPFISSSEWTELKGSDFTKKLIVAHFNSIQDGYLYWHCPLDFIREYLENQCGYKKANWFVKLFWKY